MAVSNQAEVRAKTEAAMKDKPAEIIIPEAIDPANPPAMSSTGSELKGWSISRHGLDPVIASLREVVETWTRMSFVGTERSPSAALWALQESRFNDVLAYLDVHYSVALSRKVERRIKSPLRKLIYYDRQPEWRIRRIVDSLEDIQRFGGKWPDCDGRSPGGGAIFMSQEDDWGDTLAPRFISAGADQSKIVALADPTKGGGN
jgi:hypothetical protein